MINPAARETASRGSCSQAEAEPISHRAKTYHSWQMAALRLQVAACLVVAVANPLAIRSAAAQAPAAEADRVMVIGTKESPPFAMKGDDGSWTGISIDLWRRVANDLHLRYRLQEVSLDELISGTAAHRLDAAVAAISVTAEREQRVDFTQPYYATGLGIAVPKTSIFNWMNLLKALISFSFLEAFALLVGATVLVGVIIWMIERRHTEHFSGGVRQGLTTSMLWSAKTLTQSMPEQGPTTLIGRLIAVMWLAAAVTTIAVFTAGITTHLTTRELRGYVRGVRDLRSVRVGAVADTAALVYLKAEHIRFRPYPSLDAGLQAVKAGTLDAFVYDKPLLLWFVKSRGADSLQVLDAVFDPQNYAIALPLNSPLRTDIDRALLDAVATQWWQDLTADYLGTD